MDRSIEGTLRELVSGGIAPFGAARSLANMLKTPELDWRNLARAIGDISRTQPPDAVATEGGQDTLQTVAVLAMEMACRTIIKANAARTRSAVATALALRDACSAGRAPLDMLRAIVRALRAVLPFEIATFVEYQTTPTRETLARGWFAVDGETEFDWPARWMRIGPGLADLLKGDQLWFESMDDFRRSSPDAARALADPIGQVYAERGIKTFLIMPYKEGDRLVATLTLARKADGSGQVAPFDQAAVEDLHGLGLPSFLGMVMAAWRAERIALRDRVRALFTLEANPHEVAKKAVELIAVGFGWEYAGIFRLSRTLRRFEVLHEYDPSGAFGVGADFVQGLDEGMLGAVRIAGKPLIAYDLRKGPPEHDYRRERPAPVSAMCFPIRLRNDTEWLLHCESSRPDTFQEPDAAAIQRVVANFETTLALWYESRLTKALLGLVSQGVVITDETNKVERANDAAVRLLGGERAKVVERSLEDFGADESGRMLLNWKGAPSSPAHVRLRTPAGQECGALVMARDSQDTFGRRIWLMSSLDELEWIGRAPHLRETVQGVAAQTRGSLLLATSLVRRAKAACETEAPTSIAGPLLNRALRGIAKADITYERLATAAEVLKRPIRQERVAPFGLTGALTEMRLSLPMEDCEALQLDMGLDRTPGVPAVRADSGRLLFAMRSIVSYLLAIRSLGATVSVVARPEGAGLRLTASLGGVRSDVVQQYPDDDDRIQQVEHEAREMAEIATEAATAVIEAHGGGIHSDRDEGGVRFTIWLPAASEGGA